jgi:hypothetical protein
MVESKVILLSLIQGATSTKELQDAARAELAKKP